MTSKHGVEKPRCSWAGTDPLMRRYHDEEWGVPEHDGRALLDELVAHSTQRQFVYTHRWRVHDLVIWDNRCTMHRGTDFDDLRWKRDMQRATVANSCEQEGVAVAAA